MYAYGGAIYNRNTYLTLNNCTFENNSVSGNSLFGNLGGAITNNDGFVDIINCTFINNTVSGPSSYGGAVATYSSSAITRIFNSSFSGNKANATGKTDDPYSNVQLESAFGGAVGTYSGGLSIVDNSYFANNTAGSGGAVGNVDSRTVVTNNTFINNNATNGGAVGGTRVYGTAVTNVTNNTMINNTAYNGAGVAIMAGSGNIINNTMTCNNATNGGAIANENGITVIEGNQLVNNTGIYGGAIASQFGSTNITSNNITCNNATRGGAVANDNSTVIITNNILAGNTADAGATIYTLTGNTTINANNITSSNGITSVIYNNGSTILDKNYVFNNTVSDENSYVVYSETSTNINVTGNSFYNNTDFKRDMLFNDFSSQNTTNNIYISNYLETSSPDDVTITLNDNIYTLNYTINIRNVYNDTVRTGYVKVNINGEYYTEQFPVNNGNVTVTIPKSSLTFENNIILEYISEDKSYQPINKTAYIEIVKDTTITVITNNTVKIGSNVEIQGELRDEDNDIVPNAEITISVNDDETIKVITDANGKYSVNYTTKVLGTNNVTVNYNGNKSYNPSTNKTTFNVEKRATIIIINPVKSVIGEQFTLTAYVTDIYGDKVNGGNLVFKLNGKTLRNDGSFNSTEAPLKFKVVDGVVTYTLTADLYLRNAKNLSASYSGSYNYEANTSDITTAEIAKRTAQITVTTINTTKQDVDIEFTAHLKDITPHGTNMTAINEDGYVIFKLNGVTLKDASGKVVKVKVENNTAKYTYHVPIGMASDDGKNNTRNYTVEAVYQNDIFYPDTRNTTVFHVEKSPINIQFTKVIIDNTTKTMNITGNITDYKGNLLVGVNKVCVKVNNATIRDAENNTIFYTVRNGIIDIKDVNVTKAKTFNDVMVVSGDRQAYLEGRNTTTELTIKN
ncbi:Ig-like domain repeat protein [Methanosphaera sp. WGK6]|uniref:beta strand repeat-containing protein n=1 Tax=Methanosphaera sp. WGK6 TaxID=1561964 RepID=UPI00084BC41B|nr:Ig-like domain repeat protein [Methanosphaera sp. WGK6]OED30401.1 hypothetical protein NL43_03280 [Methanosphaera sp. WGK6]